MSADFWAGYISGAAGIVIGNPLDVLKVRLQASAVSSGASSPESAGPPPGSTSTQQHASRRISGLRGLIDYGKFSRGLTPPLLTYGPLNALLFVSYNRSLSLIDPLVLDPSNPPASTPLTSIWLAGAIGGFATWIVSTPTESVKCRAQIGGSTTGGSLAIARDMWRRGGVRRLYTGGGITSVRDAVGYGFYFWSYELCKRAWQMDEEDSRGQALRVLVCGGIAGVVTWASIFPLDVVKTRYQTQDMEILGRERRPLLSNAGEESVARTRRGALQIAREAYRQEGIAVFFRGLGVCSARAFIVNAVQWMVYEWVLDALRVG